MIGLAREPLTFSLPPRPAHTGPTQERRMLGPVISLRVAVRGKKRGPRFCFPKVVVMPLPELVRVFQSRRDRSQDSIVVSARFERNPQLRHVTRQYGA